MQIVALSPTHDPRFMLRTALRGTMAIRWRATVQNGPKAVRVDQCYLMERMLRCLDLGTIASEGLCSAGGPSSGRLSEAS